MQKEIQYDEVFDAQRHYRLLLDSMARPGKINSLPEMELTVPKGIHAAGALIGFALLNADVSYCAEGPSAYEVSGYLLVNTSARPASKEDADYIFINSGASPELLRQVKVGTLPYPEDSATLVLAVDGLAYEGEGVGLTLTGPGVPGERKLCVAGATRAFFETLAGINGEFPLGIDVILTDADRRVAAIPRSTKIGFS